ncbi:MAG TPA: pitrilysin family protein [Polyangiaceae bacterium]|nr:pitrilysin family protein [Polyangiaceae bacterium]
MSAHSMHRPWRFRALLAPCWFLAPCLIANPSLAQTPATAPAPAVNAAATPTANAPTPTNALDPALQIRFTKYTLDNGLEVILHRDTSLPLVALNMWYHVGPVNEPPGRSGFAHLFEHLMFEGSRYVGRQFDTLLESVGATNVNGTTSWDRTNYFETVPSEHLELLLWLESDRMGYMLDAITQERLDVQRGVVKNERRQSYENQPYGPSTLALYDALYPKGHPYHGAVIGSMEDLDRASLQDVQQFFRDYYAPSNATLVLAGDFDEARTLLLIEKYFGGLPKKPRPRTQHPLTPPLKSEIALTVKEGVDLGRVTLSWLTPPAFSAEETALAVATEILAGGKASRLYQELVVKRKIASDVSAYVDANALCSDVEVSAMVASKAKPEQVQQVISSVLDDLAQHGPSDAELARAKKGMEVELKSSLQLLNGHGGESGRAGILQRLNHYLGDPGRLAAEWQKTLAVTPADVQRVVRDYLRPDRRAVMNTVPAAPDAGSNGGAP